MSTSMILTVAASLFFTGMVLLGPSTLAQQASPSLVKGCLLFLMQPSKTNKRRFMMYQALRHKCRIILVSLLFSLTLLTSGSTLDGIAQEPTGVSLGQSSSNVSCEPMMSNVTIPDPSQEVLPPEMYMVYEDALYLGELSQSKYREGETFSELGILPENISSQLPAEIVELRNGTCVEFIVRGTPSTLPPDSLDVSAYSADGTPAGVLDATEDSTSIFRIDLPSGQYVLLATSTWIPSSEDEYVTGYVIYKFLTNVTQS